MKDGTNNTVYRLRRGVDLDAELFVNDVIGQLVGSLVEDVHDHGWALMQMVRNPLVRYHNGDRCPVWFEPDYGCFYYIDRFDRERQIEAWAISDQESRSWHAVDGEVQ